MAARSTVDGVDPKERSRDANIRRRKQYSALDATSREEDTELKAKRKALTIQPVQQHRISGPLWAAIILYRSGAALCYISFLGMFVAIPFLALVRIERAAAEMGLCQTGLVWTSFLKRYMAMWCLVLMGVRVRCEGVEVIKHVRPGLVHFTHSSYMDALLLLATYPHNLTAFVKAELFRIPFLGWISLAFGSIPIYRKDRSQAIAVVDRTAERCIARGDSLAVAPEGTRSKSGNLMDFKKGPFYLAENMQWPIVPTVILGNYELWPPNRAMPDSGTVVVRFLEKVQVPVKRGEVEREKLSSKVRQILLAGLEDIAEDAGAALHPIWSAGSYLSCAVTYVVSWLFCRSFLYLTTQQGISLWGVGGCALLYTLLGNLVVQTIIAMDHSTDGRKSS